MQTFLFSSIHWDPFWIVELILNEANASISHPACILNFYNLDFIFEIYVLKKFFVPYFEKISGLDRELESCNLVSLADPSPSLHLHITTLAPSESLDWATRAHWYRHMCAPATLLATDWTGWITDFLMSHHHYRAMDGSRSFRGLKSGSPNTLPLIPVHYPEPRKGDRQKCMHRRYQRHKILSNVIK